MNKCSSEICSKLLGLSFLMVSILVKRGEYNNILRKEALCFCDITDNALAFCFTFVAVFLTCHFLYTLDKWRS